MAQEQLVAVEYVGLKPRRADTVTGSGIVWTGAGDVQLVPAKVWERLRRHVDIWRETAMPKDTLAQAEPAPVAPVVAEAPAAADPPPDTQPASTPARFPAAPKNKGGRPKGSTKVKAAA